MLCPLAVFHLQFAVHIESLAGYMDSGGFSLRTDRHFLPDHYVIAEAYGDTYDKPQDDLRNQLGLFAQPFLVVSEYLYIVIREAEQPQPYSAD